MFHQIALSTWKELFDVMSVSFLFCLPLIVGALTIYLSSVENVENLAYRIMVPWIPIFLFFVITLFFAIVTGKHATLRTLCF